MTSDTLDSATKKEYDGTQSWGTTRMGTAPFPAALDDQISSALEEVEQESYQWLLDSPKHKTWHSGEKRILNIVGEGKNTCDVIPNA